MLGYVIWNADPELFSLGPFTVRWYGLAFVIGFLSAIKWWNGCFAMRARLRNGSAYC